MPYGWIGASCAHRRRRPSLSSRQIRAVEPVGRRDQCPAQRLAARPSRHATGDVGRTSSHRRRDGEELIFFVDAIVVGATIMPGFLMCVPALILIIAPVVAIGLVAAAAGLVIFLATAPVRLAWRVARRLRHGLAARRVRRALTVPRVS